MGKSDGSSRYGLTLAVKEHLASGEPITRLEALVLFGVSNLTDMVSELRKQGMRIESHTIPFARAVVRVNKYARLEPPPNLPIREIVITEYWLER